MVLLKRCLFEFSLITSIIGRNQQHQHHHQYQQNRISSSLTALYQNSINITRTVSSMPERTVDPHPHLPADFGPQGGWHYKRDEGGYRVYRKERVLHRRPHHIGEGGVQVTFEIRGVREWNGSTLRSWTEVSSISVGGEPEWWHLECGSHPSTA